jgi:hypothetical protein
VKQERFEISIGIFFISASLRITNGSSDRLGIALIAFGIVMILLGAVTFPTMGFGGCTERTAVDRGFPEFQGYNDGTFHYTDGKNNFCEIPAHVPLIPLGSLLGGMALVVSGRRS